MSSKLGKLNKAVIDVAQELAFALIDIRDKSFASYMFVDEESYKYGMEVRARAEQGLDNLNKLQEALNDE